MPCNEILITSGTVPKNYINKTDLCFIDTILLVSGCLFLLMIIAINYFYYYCTKRQQINQKKLT